MIPLTPDSIKPDLPKTILEKSTNENKTKARLNRPPNNCPIPGIRNDSKASNNAVNFDRCLLFLCITNNHPER